MCPRLKYLQTDYYYEPYYKIVEHIETPNLTVPGAPPSDNNLINGKGNADCSKAPPGTSCVPNAGLSVFKFQSGKTHRLRLINAGAEGLQRFSIDNHEMTILTNDFVPIIPYTTNVVTLGIGQRTDILVTANGSSTDAVWMRSDIGGPCSGASKPLALAAIYYEDADNTTDPTTTGTPIDKSHCGNVSTVRTRYFRICSHVPLDPLSKTNPWFDFGPLPSPAVTQQIDITNRNNESGVNQWYMNNVTFRANYESVCPELTNTHV